MDEKRWNARFDELDTEICAVQDVANNAHWPAIAIALTLIDAGSVERKTLIAITECLRDLLAARSEPGTTDETAKALDEFHHWVSLPFEQGKVLGLLETLEHSAILDVARRSQKRGK